MKTEIGSYEAKTKLPELLRQVRSGRSFTITNRGEAIADLVPSAGVKTKDAAAAVRRLHGFHAVRSGARREHQAAHRRRARVSFVLDNSVAMRWFFGDGEPQELAYAVKVLEALKGTNALVPVTWGLDWKSPTSLPGRKQERW